MSLFGTIQQSSGALQTAQIGLQVVGNNVANANTPGYLRQTLQQVPAVAFRNGNLLQGHGVRPVGITQTVDANVVERMFQARSALEAAEFLDNTYSQLEQIANDLDNTGINSQLTAFNNSLHELSTRPNDVSLSEFVILQADTLAQRLQSTREQVLQRRTTVDSEIEAMARDINRLTSRIAEANLTIATVEGGGLLRSDATGVRDQRLLDLEELAAIVDINIQEQESGAISVFVGGDYLVVDGTTREVEAVYSSVQGQVSVNIAETDSPLDAKQGRLASAIQARDGVFEGFLEGLDATASALIQGVNSIHTQGQGSEGFEKLVSSLPDAEFGVPLDNAGLSSNIQNGYFDVTLHDSDGSVLSTTRIDVRKLDQVGDSTIQSIVDEINLIDGIDASVGLNGRITIETESPDNRFTFANENSGFLAAAGINTFFTGTTAGDIAVNEQLIENPKLLAISRNGIGEDTEILIELVDLVDRPLDVVGGRSIRSEYEESIARLAQQTRLNGSASEGLRNLYDSLQNQHLAISGVNIDEESIKMISYQRAFQASSRVITTAAEMLDILVNL
ncbi:MAG: flagellar hook-associated protein FlgK [Planctomycetota bacterium]